MRQHSIRAFGVWGSRLLLASSALAGVSAAIAIGCGDSGDGSTFDDGNKPEAGSTTTPPLLPPVGPNIAFPKDPIIDGTAPANAAELFAGGAAGTEGGPCLMEPEVGAMFPRNWLRPRFRWIAPGAAADPGITGTQNLFELRVHADNQQNDLVVYTSSRNWTMPRAMWDLLRTNSAGVPMTMTVRGGTFAGGTLTNVSAGSGGPLSIAPVDAPGTIVYWTTTSGGDAGPNVYNPVLKGFRVGDESVRDVLRPAQMPATGLGAVKCVGCHSSTPDGFYAVPSTRPNPSGGGATQVGFGDVDGSAQTPPYLTPNAQALLNRSQQMAPAFSAAHFSAGDRIAVTMMQKNPGGDPVTGFDIVWTDLESTSSAQGTGWGIFARTGDPGQPALANVSHDGTKIVYVSTPQKDTAGTIVVDGKLYTIPWGNRQGGTATELPGANADGFRQFYPAFSPDDAFIAYDRSIKGGTEPKNNDSYNDVNAELHVIPASGGTAQRLIANDPPACAGTKSPGVKNSWPKWAPNVGTAGGKKYYFIVFSSARSTAVPELGAQLYLAPVVVEGTTITTYSALYLWNQPENEDNHAPAWDTLKIPEVITR